MGKKQVLIVYYSFSSQTQLLVQRLVSGLKEYDIEVTVKLLQPVDQIPFPFSSFFQMVKVMVFSFFRHRVAVNPVSTELQKDWDLIILGGPTWSYNPSGPVLSFLDGPGAAICRNQTVLPLISCRSYWRTHFWGLRHILKRLGARVKSPLVYEHSAGEPWRTVGLFVQLLGRLPRRNRTWFRRVYKRYGHDKDQYLHIQQRGREIARELLAGDQRE